jgi:O-antigen/teichoic acid export membrane protein
MARATSRRVHEPRSSGLADGLPAGASRATGPTEGSAVLHWSKGGLSPVTPQMAAVILGCATAFNLIGNLAFHTLVARKSSVGSYGVTSLFLSFGVLAGVLSSGFQYAAARHVAQDGSTVEAELRKLLPLVGVVVPLALLVVLCRPIGEFVHVDSQLDMFLASLYVFVTVGQAVPFGVLNGGRHFRTLAVTVLFGVSVRLVLFAVLAGGHETTTMALTSSIISTGSAGVLAMVVARRFQAAAGGRLRGDARGVDPLDPPIASTAMSVAPLVGEEPGPASRARGRARLDESTEGLIGGLLGAGLWATWILALVFARHYLAPTPAGIFGVAQVVGGAILFMAAPIAAAYVPSMAGSRDTIRPALTGLLLTAVVCGVATLGLALLGGPAISLLYGAAYRPPEDLLLAVGVAASLVACATFLLWSTRSQRVRLLLSRRAFYVAVPVSFGLEIVFGLLWHRGMVALALGPGVAVVAGLALGILADRILSGRILSGRILSGRIVSGGSSTSSRRAG